MRADVAVEIEPGAGSERQVGADAVLQRAKHGGHAVAAIEHAELFRPIVIGLRRSARQPRETIATLN